MELQIEARNLEMQPEWQEKIELEREKLIRHHAGQVLHLRLSIESTQHHRNPGFELRLVAAVPNDIEVVRRGGEKLMPLIVEAFDVLGLNLKERQRRLQKSVKLQEPERGSGEVGIIKRLYPYESYGFLVTLTGREIYFHENALKEELAEGDAVLFGEADGDKGPAAAWVRPSR